MAVAPGLSRGIVHELLTVSIGIYGASVLLLAVNILIRSTKDYRSGVLAAALLLIAFFLQVTILINERRYFTLSSVQ